MKSLLDLIKALYGPKAISSTIGTRTNVIRLPSGKLQKYIKTDLNIEAASDAAAQNAYNEMKELIPEVPKMNDGERLIFEGNLRRLKNKVKPEEVNAEVFKFETKEPVSKEGITQLIEEAGQTARPGTLMGNLESRINRLKALSKEGMKTEDILKDFATGQQGMARLQDEGLVRAAARQILINDIKAGKIKNITVEEAINMKEPIEPFRTLYGEGALEQLDSLIPEFRSLKTETEAEKLARSKFEFEPKSNRPKESYTEEEMKKILEEPEKKANGGRIGFKTGSGKKILDLINKAGEGKFTKQEALEKIIQKTIEANPTDQYVQKTFPNFIKEIRENPELANNENVWNTFTEGLPENKKFVVYGDNTVDFFTKGENLPEGMKQTIDLVDTYGISMKEARRIKQLEPEDQVMEIKKLEVLKKRTENAKGGSAGLDYLMGF